MHIFYALIAYLSWFKKPQNMNTPTVLDMIRMDWIKLAKDYFGLVMLRLGGWNTKILTEASVYTG